MPKISKFYDSTADVKLYDGLADFAKERKIALKQRTEEEDRKDAPLLDPNEKGISKAEAQRREKRIEDRKKADEEKHILSEAEKQAQKIIDKAKRQAEKIKAKALDEAASEGFEIGFSAGFKKAEMDSKKTIGVETETFTQLLKDYIREIDYQKEEILRKYKDDLTNLAIAIAEKVIHTSLKSSGEVIERMIISASEDIRSKEWAKIYLSKTDTQKLIKGDAQFLRAISGISEQVKIISMSDEPSGACIIELPDQIIDASAQTQIENIKGIIKNSGI